MLWPVCLLPAAAQFTLGIIDRLGEDMPQDYKEAIRWFRAANSPLGPSSLVLFDEEGKVVWSAP